MGATFHFHQGAEASAIVAPASEQFAAGVLQPPHPFAGLQRAYYRAITIDAPTRFRCRTALLNGLRFTASFSCFPDGRAAEIFLQNHKPGSQSDAHARDAAVSASLALQHGYPLDTLQEADRQRDFQARTPYSRGRKTTAVRMPRRSH